MFWWVVTPTLTLTTPTPQMGESTECSTAAPAATAAPATAAAAAAARGFSGFRPPPGRRTRVPSSLGLATSASLVCGEAIDLDSQKSPTICRMIALSMIEVLR